MTSPLQVTVLCSGTLLVGFALGLSVHPTTPAPTPFTTPSSFSETRNSFKFKFINPLLDCDSTNISPDKNLDPLKSKIDTLVTTQKTQGNIDFASVYYRDLNNGPWFGINENELFSPSSLIKVPLLLVYLKQAQSDPTLLQKQLTNTAPFDPSAQNYPPQQHLEQNKAYTIDDLLFRMIAYSDNLAYDLLFKNIDNQLIVQIYTDLGIDLTAAFKDPNGNIISVKSYASFYRILFNSSYLNHDMSEKALSLLSQSQFNDGLTASLPSTITVAHKFGERQYLDTHQKQLHDCGIVYDVKRPYLLCIMTRGKNFNAMATTIKDISAAVYQGLDHNQ